MTHAETLKASSRSVAYFHAQQLDYHHILRSQIKCAVQLFLAYTNFTPEVS